MVEQALSVPLIRPARVADLDGLVGIENSVFASDRLSRRAFARRMASASAALLVAEHDARLAGYALVEFRSNSRLARLFSIARAPDVPAGLGGALLAACEDEARRRGCDALRLEAREDNARALRLYERAGYVFFARVANYYEDGAAALRMEKRFTP
ncbi:MAG: GNAT family N-acetyltransferase [Rhodoblastus sp.]|nr:GNAT family N-acetyltransferase [Rhodoblastus sp.]